MQPIILIPAYQPGPELAQLTDELLKTGSYRIVVVDDGSDGSGKGVIEGLKQHSRVDVLQHAVNLGKGQALKTGFNHCLTQYPDCP
jgi:glycosyltransferase involved in cell wall biosynthesis